MARLEIEVTDKLMERLQEKADEFAVEPPDMAKRIISCVLATKEKPCWIDKLTTIISRVSEIVTSVSQTDGS